jgi:integrase/recombinase XerD
MGSCGGFEISWVPEKGGPRDPTTQKMLEELQRRNYSHRTATTYVRIVRDFAEYFQQPPDKLGPEQIRQYQAHLFQAKKLAPATVSQ